MRYIASLFLILTILLPVSIQAEPNPYTTQATMQSAATGNVNGTLLNTNIGGYGFQLVTFVVSGTFTATINPEGTQDGTNWQALFCMPISGGAGATTFTAAGGWRCNLGGTFIQVRARISGYASGSVTVTGMASFAGTVANASYPASAPATTASGYYYATWFSGIDPSGVADSGAGITTALATVGSTCGTLFFPTGTYAYATSPNFAVSCVNILADRGTLFNHTGTGNAFVIDGGATGAGILGNTYENLRIQGNTSSTHGLYVRAIHHSRFVHPRVLGASTTGAAIRIEDAVANHWDTPRVSVNDGTLSPIPLYGMYLTRRSADNAVTSTQTINNPVMEGLTQTGGYGIYFDYTHSNVINGGTSEGNTNGLFISEHAPGSTAANTINSTDFESNTTNDMVIHGALNTFNAINAVGNLVFDVNGNSNTFNSITVGGTTTLNPGTVRNIFVGSFFNGAITDNGSNNFFLDSMDTVLGSVRQQIFNSATSAPRVVITYGTPMAINAALGTSFSITATNNSAFTISNPTNPTTGQVIGITIRNTSGVALGTATFDTLYKLASWTQPATGNSRTIWFEYDGTNWIEVNRTTADIPN